MLAIPDFDVVLFDVGGTLLHVALDPLDSAIASVAHLGAIDIPAFRIGVDMAVSEWRAGGGKPEHEDLTIIWVRHFTLALSRSGFEGRVDLAARQIEDALLLRRSVALELVPIAGYAKPRPETFQIATDRLGVRPERALYVGDSLSLDAYGATGAGLPAVLVDRSGVHPAYQPRVESHAELLEQLHAV